MAESKSQAIVKNEEMLTKGEKTPKQGEERERRRLATRSHRTNETPEQRQERLESQGSVDNQRWVNETPEHDGQNVFGATL